VCSAQWSQVIVYLEFQARGERDQFVFLLIEQLKSAGITITRANRLSSTSPTRDRQASVSESWECVDNVRRSAEEWTRMRLDSDENPPQLLN
jgi:hypothetical protein